MASPPPTPHPKALGSLTPWLLPGRDGGGTKGAGKVENVVTVAGNEPMWVRSKAALGPALCVLSKLLEGVGRPPEFEFCLSAWILAGRNRIWHEITEGPECSGGPLASQFL